jgi:hypothetical protein
MADGIAATMANSMLTTLTTSPASSFAQLHTADPGTAGTTGVSSVTTRKAVTWASPSAGAVAANGTLPSWASWAGTNGEVDTDTSYWTASTSGTFDMSIPLSASVTMDTGDTLSLTAISVTIPTAS